MSTQQTESVDETAAVCMMLITCSYVRHLFSPIRESVPKFIGPQFTLGQIIKVPQTWVTKPAIWPPSRDHVGMAAYKMIHIAIT